MPPKPKPRVRLWPDDAYAPDLARWLELFDAGHYRAALDPLEAFWFPTRDEFGKALIKLTVGMHQLETTDLTSGPRELLVAARKGLRRYAPVHNGINVDAARDLAALGLARLRRRAKAARAG